MKKLRTRDWAVLLLILLIALAYPMYQVYSEMIAVNMAHQAVRDYVGDPKAVLDTYVSPISGVLIFPMVQKLPNKNSTYQEDQITGFQISGDVGSDHHWYIVMIEKKGVFAYAVKSVMIDPKTH